MKEDNEGVIRLEMISESQMADILEFIYSGSVQISTQENAENLFELADYLLPNLKTFAGKCLEEHLSTTNCLSIYTLVPEAFLYSLLANFATRTASFNCFYWHEALRAEKRKPLVKTVGNLTFMPSAFDRRF